MRELLRTAGVEPVGDSSSPARAGSAHLRGKGKARRAEAGGRRLGRRIFVVDDDLDPGAAAQPRGRAQARVVDRTPADPRHLRPARASAEGKLQVELAQLEYNLPRMRGMWQHLERLGGGIGTRGPASRSSRRTAGSHDAGRASSSAGSKSSSAQRDSSAARRARGDPGRRARRLHEHRQVHASERAHGRRCPSTTGCSRPSTRPREASPTRAAATSSPTRSASSGASRTSSSRASPPLSRRR